MDNEFIEAVRVADWERALSLIRQGAVSPMIEAPSDSVYEWLVEIDAPSQLVVRLLRLFPASEARDRITADLLETCLRESTTKANAFETLSLLLADGVSPNLIVDGGSTLLQRAMELNREREVRELLRHGVDPNQMSVFGRESATNLEEALRIGNKAAQEVLAKFGQGDKSNSGLT